MREYRDFDPFGDDVGWLRFGFMLAAILAIFSPIAILAFHIWG